MLRKIKMSEICKVLKIPFPRKDVEINGLNLCNRISLHDRVLSYVTTDKYVDHIRDNKSVVCVILKESDLPAYQSLVVERELRLIVCRDPERLFYDIHDYLYYHTDFYEKYEFDKKIGENCEIHPSAVIEAGVVIGNSVVVGANTVIRRGTVIKDGCVIGCNTTIGSEGFQIVRIGGKNRKIVHCGGVEIGEGASIGDNTTICNTLFEGSTYIGMNAMVDNLIYVGHNGYVGDNAVVTAGAVLCGSAVIENDAWVGVNSSVLNRVTVGDGSKIGIGSVVTRDIPKDSLAYGVPAKVKVVLGGEETRSQSS